MKAWRQSQLELLVIPTSFRLRLLDLVSWRIVSLVVKVWTSVCRWQRSWFILQEREETTSANGIYKKNSKIRELEEFPDSHFPEKERENEKKSLKPLSNPLFILNPESQLQFVCVSITLLPFPFGPAILARSSAFGSIVKWVRVLNCSSVVWISCS